MLGFHPRWYNHGCHQKIQQTSMSAMWVNPAMPKLEFPTTAKTRGMSWISMKRRLNGWESSSLAGTHAAKQCSFFSSSIVMVLALVFWFSTCCCQMSLLKVSCFPMNLPGVMLIGCCTSCSGCTCGQSHESSPLRPCCSRYKAPKSAIFFPKEDKCILVTSNESAWQYYFLIYSNGPK